MARIERPHRSVTIIDVAREAGVSYATVSRVINNQAHVKSEKREAVLAAMSRLGYVVNQQARSLASGRSRIIGLLVQTLGNSWMGQIIRGIDEELAAAQYDMMLYTAHRRLVAESSYVSMITRGSVDGLLLIIPRDPSGYLESLRSQHLPYVLIDNHGSDDGEPSISVTNFEGAYTATRYLIELGHRRIGFVTGNMAMASAVNRLKGYSAALVDYALPNDPALIIEGDFLQQSGFSAGKKLFALPNRPTAIFVSNDVMAFGLMDAARDQGLRIPDDVSVIGFDDIPEAASIYPPLTTIRQPLEQMGRMGARILLRAIDDPFIQPERIVLPTELIVRCSCQPLP
jgi:LacI family transcriptional regulator